MKRALSLIVLTGIGTAFSGLSPAGETQLNFAEELKDKATYSAVFELKINKKGMVEECSFSKMSELTEEAKEVDISPSESFVEDGCRKLSRAKWTTKGKENTLATTYYYCLYAEQDPIFAFCERKFGE